MGRRILLLTRRFWPLCSPPEARLLELVDQWRVLGAEISVVTPQWDRTWPLHLVVREMPVTRLAYSPRRLWGEFWYLRRLHQWLQKRANDFDLIVVWRLRLDSLVASRTGQRLNVPVVYLYEGCGAEGEAAWLHRSPHRSRILSACRQGAAILSFSEAGLEESQRLGCALDRCHFSGVIMPPEEEVETRRASARIHLLESNRDLFTTGGTLVGLTIAPLEERDSMRVLFAAWEILRDTHHDAKLWWIGDGVKRSSLYAMLGDYDLRYHAVLPGDFDDPTELLAAANLYVATTAKAGLLMYPALRAGIPVIAADTLELRGMLPREAPVLFYRQGDAHDLAAKLRAYFDAPGKMQELGLQGKVWSRAHGSTIETARNHLALFDSLVQARTSSPKGTLSKP